jgi:hypothetical protein
VTDEHLYHLAQPAKHELPSQAQVGHGILQRHVHDCTTGQRQATVAASARPESALHGARDCWIEAARVGAGGAALLGLTRLRPDAEHLCQLSDPGMAVEHAGEGKVVVDENQ